MPVNDQQYQVPTDTQINNIHKELKTVRNNTSTRAEKQLAYKTACDLFKQMQSAGTNINNNACIGIWMELTALQHDFQNTPAPQERTETTEVFMDTPPPGAFANLRITMDGNLVSTEIEINIEDEDEDTEVDLYVQDPGSNTETPYQSTKTRNILSFFPPTSSNFGNGNRSNISFRNNSTEQTTEHSAHDNHCNRPKNF